MNVITVKIAEDQMEEIRKARRYERLTFWISLTVMLVILACVPFIAHWIVWMAYR